MKAFFVVLLAAMAVLLAMPVDAAVDLPAVTVTTEEDGSESYSISIQILAVMTRGDVAACGSSTANAGSPGFTYRSTAPSASVSMPN